MKPFDLDAFKAGAPAVDGRGTEWHYLGINTFTSNEFNKVVAVRSGGAIVEFSETGMYSANIESKNNLSMAPQKRSGWINLYCAVDGRKFLGAIFYSNQCAESELSLIGTKLATIEIHWEE